MALSIHKVSFIMLYRCIGMTSRWFACVLIVWASQTNVKAVELEPEPENDMCVELGAGREPNGACAKTVCYVQATDDFCQVDDIGGTPAVGGFGAVVQRPLNYPVNMFEKPNTSIFFATPEMELSIIKAWAKSHPQFGTSIVLHETFKKLHEDTQDLDAEVIRKEVYPHYLRDPLGPDMYLWWPGLKTTNLKEDLLDLRDIFDETGLSEVLDPRVYKVCQDEETGAIYCATKGGGPYWFMYSRSVFESVGVPIPKTFDALILACQTLRAEGLTPIGIPAKSDWVVSAWFDTMNMRVNGGDFHRELTSGVVPWTDQRVRRTFTEWQRLIDARCFDENPLENGVVQKEFLDRMRSTPTRSKDIASVFLGDYYRPLVWHDEGEMDDIDVFTFPEVTPGVVRGNMLPAPAYIVRRTTRQKAAIGNFLAEGLYTRQSGLTDAERMLSAPRIDRLPSTSRFYPKLQQLLDETDLQWTAFDLEVLPPFWKAIRRDLQLWFNGSKPLDEMLSEFEDHRILTFKNINLAPESSLQSGSYQDEVSISLKSRDRSTDPNKMKILYSINDENLIIEEFGDAIKLGLGEWTVRAQVDGGARGKSEVARFSYNVVAEAIVEESGFPMLLIITLFCGAISLGAILYGAVAFIRHYREIRRGRDERNRLKRERVRNSIANATKLSYPMCVIAFNKFKKLTRLVPHEEVLSMGKLVFLHTYEQVQEFKLSYEIVFFSHQWLGKTHPDIGNVHYNAILGAIAELCAKRDILTSNIWIWVDYISIPQVNPITKSLSVSSLAVYASSASYFCAIVPPAKHHDTKAVCDEVSYSKRGWCRLEQWACFALAGPESMCVYSRELSFRDADMDPDFLMVFSGDFTVDSDKEKMVDVVVGVWTHSVYHMHALPDIVQTRLQKNNEDVFPSHYFADLLDMAEEELKRTRDGSLVEQALQKSGMLVNAASTVASNTFSERSSGVIIPPQYHYEEHSSVDAIVDSAISQGAFPDWISEDDRLKDKLKKFLENQREHSRTSRDFIDL